MKLSTAAWVLFLRQEPGGEEIYLCAPETSAVYFFRGPLEEALKFGNARSAYAYAKRYQILDEWRVGLRNGVA